MYPEGSTMTPEPVARGSSRRRRKRSTNSSPKNSRNRSSSAGDASLRGMALTFTTAGVTRSATLANASARARSTAWGPASGASRRPAHAATVMRNMETRTRRACMRYQKILTGAGANLLERLDGQLHEVARGGRHRRLRPPAEATDPHDLVSGFHEGQPVAVPARDLGVDQKRFEAPLATLGERPETVAALAATDVKRHGERVGVECHAASITGENVPGGADVTCLDSEADFGQQRHAGYVEDTPPEMDGRGDVDPDEVAADVERDTVEPERSPRRWSREHAAQAAMCPRAQRPTVTEAHGAQAEDVGRNQRRQPGQRRASEYERVAVDGGQAPERVPGTALQCVHGLAGFASDA